MFPGGHMRSEPTIIICLIVKSSKKAETSDNPWLNVGGAICFEYLCDKPSHQCVCVLICVSGVREQDGRCVRGCVITRRPRCPSSIRSSCAPFVKDCCSVTNTDHLCCVCLDFMAAVGNITSGVAVNRETVAATRSEK